MRTTITLDDDVAIELERRQRAGNRSFKDIVNETLRAGLYPALATSDRALRYTQPRSVGTAPDIADVSAVLAVLDEGKHVRIAPRSRT